MRFCSYLDVLEIGHFQNNLTEYMALKNAHGVCELCFVFGEMQIVQYLKAPDENWFTCFYVFSITKAIRLRTARKLPLRKQNGILNKTKNGTRRT